MPDDGAAMIGVGVPGSYTAGMKCLYDEPEQCPDIDCTHQIYNQGLAEGRRLEREAADSMKAIAVEYWNHCWCETVGAPEKCEQCKALEKLMGGPDALYALARPHLERGDHVAGEKGKP